MLVGVISVISLNATLPPKMGLKNPEINDVSSTYLPSEKKSGVNNVMLIKFEAYLTFRKITQTHSILRFYYFSS